MTIDIDAMAQMQAVAREAIRLGADPSKAGKT